MRFAGCCPLSLGKSFVSIVDACAHSRGVPSVVKAISLTARALGREILQGPQDSQFRPFCLDDTSNLVGMEPDRFRSRLQVIHKHGDNFTPEFLTQKERKLSDILRVERCMREDYCQMGIRR
jgi:hypothetical protein